MPAAAVIPVPIAYIKVVAVEKIVGGLVLRMTCLPSAKEKLREESEEKADAAGMSGWFNPAKSGPFA